MNIEKTVDGYANKMVVTGLIKSVEDSNYFKEVMVELLNTPSKNLTIYINDSFIITSSIIGTMLKAVNVDKANITLYAKQQDLYNLLEQLNLVGPLNVRLM